MSDKKLVIGISGASGFLYGIKALALARELGVETHLVMSRAAGLTQLHETELTRQDVEKLADVVYPINAVGAAISSGSFSTMGMLIAPCSMHTLAAIANGISDNLLTRAADVVLKERRRLVLMVRETPLHLIHLRNMQQVTECGAIVFPPVPALYAGPTSIDEIVTHSVARALDLFELHYKNLPRWGGLPDGLQGKTS